MIDDRPPELVALIERPMFRPNLAEIRAALRYVASVRLAAERARIWGA